MSHPYSVLLLGQEGARREAVADAVRARFHAAGFPDHWLQTVQPEDFDLLQPSFGRAAIYLGGHGVQSEQSATLARAYVDRGWFILPVVPTRVDYAEQVPAALLDINGVELPDGASPPPALANLVLAGLGLLRDRRRVFISYLRRESTGVANQLASALVKLGYQAFLDTRSIDGGRRLADTLWESLSDADLVVLLDTPGALDSKWVAGEIQRATALNITVLHLVWPDHQRVREADFSAAEYLQRADFLGRPPYLGRGGRLRAAPLWRVLQQIERLRAKSWGLRRAQIAGGFVRRLRGRVDPIRQFPNGLIQVAERRATVLPVVGAPLSADFQRVHEAAGTEGEGHVLYQAQCLSGPSQRHLAWLGDHLPAKPLALEQVADWLGGA